MGIHAQSHVNLDTNNPVFMCGKLNQQLKMMGCKITNIRDYQAMSCTKQNGTSKTIIMLSKPTIAALPCPSLNNKNHAPIFLLETGVESHIIPTEIINSGTNCNSVVSNTPDNGATVLKNLLDFPERTMIQAGPHVYGSYQVDRYTHEGELLVLNPDTSKFTTHRNESHVNFMGNICTDYLKQIFIKPATDIISTVNKYIENCNNGISSQNIPDSGSDKRHTMFSLSESSEVSASEIHWAESKAFGMQADMISVVGNYHISGLEEERAHKIISKTDLSVLQQRKCLQTMYILLCALPTILRNKAMPLYTRDVSIFNTLYLWQEEDRSQVLEIYNAVSKKNDSQAVCTTYSNSNSFQQHSSTLADCVSFSGSNRQLSLIEIQELFDGRKVICKDNIPFKSNVLQEDAVIIECEASTHSEQHGLDSGRSEQSNITMQKKAMGADTVCDLYDFTRYSTDKAVNDFSGHPIIKFQDIRSLSQPSLPTYLLYSSTDDEELSESADDGSDNLSEIFNECEDINQENISELLGAFTEDAKGSKQREMPCNAVNVLPRKFAEDETPLADCSQHLYTVQSDHLDGNIKTKLKVNILFNELYNKSKKLHLENDMLRFYEEEELPCPPSPLMDDNSNNDHEVPLEVIQDTNIWYREYVNTLKMDPEIIQNITVVEDHVNGREYRSSNKQCLSLPQSHSETFSGKVIPDGNVQCEVSIPPDITNSWKRSEDKMCTEKAERRHYHPMPSACSSNQAQGEDTQCEACAASLPSDTNTNKTKVHRTTTQTHDIEEEMCCIPVANRKIHSTYEPCVKRDNISSPEHVSTQKAHIVTSPVSPHMCSSDFNHHLPIQDIQTVSLNSDPKPVSNSWDDDCHQTEPLSYPCTQNDHSHIQISEVHNRSPENTLNLCIDMAIKKYKYKNDIHIQSHYTEVKPTRDVTVQTNIRSLINSQNQNYCFVCFNNRSNSNQFNSNGVNSGIHQNFTLKRSIEALYLECVSVHKKPRYVTLKPSLETDIYNVPVNLSAKSKKSESNEDFFSDDSNEESDPEDEEHLPEVKDASIMNGQNFLDSDHKVPEVGKDISWMEDTMNENELYMTDQIMKGKVTSLIYSYN
jgi:hypothetical protein